MKRIGCLVWVVALGGIDARADDRPRWVGAEGERVWLPPVLDGEPVFAGKGGEWVGVGLAAGQ